MAAAWGKMALSKTKNGNWRVAASTLSLTAQSFYERVRAFLPLVAYAVLRKAK